MKITVTMSGKDYEVAIKPADHIAYSTTARRHHWPTNPQEDPLLFGYFTAFAAMKRQGYITPETGWEAFMDDVDDIVLPTESEAEPDPFPRKK